MFSRMLAESVVLAGFGGALGLALAYGGVRFLVARLPDPGSRGNAIIQLDFVGIDGWVLGFTLAISVLTALLVGLAPAWKASRPDLNEALKDVRTSLASGQRGRRVHNLLVIGEVAVALVLVVGAALMVQSLVRLNGVSPGFRKEDVLTLTTQFNWSKFRDWKKVYASQRELLESIERLPGVRSAAATARLPMGGWYQWGYFRVKDRAPTSPSDRPREIYDVVTPKFFLTAGIPLLKGRDFDYSDTDERPPVAIINDEVARRYFPNEDSVGKYIEITGRKTVAYEIVGVVGSVRNQGLHEPPVPVLYFPHTQWGGISLVLLVRTTSDPMSLVPSVRAAIRRQDSSAPLYKISTLENLVADSTWDRRFTVLVLSSLAGLALMLALVGVYGVVQYSVTRQTREIGVRIALGAHPRDVLRLVVGRGFKLATLGVAVGLAASLALTRVISSQLYGIKATDLATYTVVSVLLVAVAVLASYLPARRATRVDPIVALRYE
jgi:putative ABC transport system permease protein